MKKIKKILFEKGDLIIIKTKSRTESFVIKNIGHKKNCIVDCELLPIDNIENDNIIHLSKNIFIK